MMKKIFTIFILFFAAQTFAQLKPVVGVQHGGTGDTTLSGILYGKGTSPIKGIAIPGDSTLFLRGDTTWSAVSGGTTLPDSTGHSGQFLNTANGVLGWADAGEGTTKNFIQGAFSIPTASRYFLANGVTNNGSTGNSFTSTDTANSNLWGAYVCHSDGTLKNLYVKADHAPTGTKGDTVWIVINGVIGHLVTVLTADEQFNMDSIGTDTVLRGDLIEYKAVRTSGSATSTVSVSLEYDTPYAYHYLTHLEFISGRKGEEIY